MKCFSVSTKNHQIFRVIKRGEGVCGDQLCHETVFLFRLMSLGPCVCYSVGFCFLCGLIRYFCIIVFSESFLPETEINVELSEDK